MCVLIMVVCSLNSDYCPIHLALLDEVVSNHPLLHSSVLGLYMDLFEGSYGQMEILAILEIKKVGSVNI